MPSTILKSFAIHHKPTGLIRFVEAQVGNNKKAWNKILLDVQSEILDILVLDSDDYPWYTDPLKLLLTHKKVTREDSISHPMFPLNETAIELEYTCRVDAGMSQKELDMYEHYVHTVASSLLENSVFTACRKLGIGYLILA